MPGEFLPPVITILEADISPAVAKIEEFKGIIKSIGDAKIPVGFEIDQASLANLKVTANLATHAIRTTIPVDTNLNTASVLATASAVRALNSAVTGGSGGGGYRGYGVIGLLRKEVQLWGGLFGDTNMIGQVQGWHIALDGLIETLLAFGPALIDLGLGFYAMAPAIEDIYDRMKSADDVAKAFGADLSPLGGEMSRLQQAMGPQTVEAWGGVLNLFKSGSGGLSGVISSVVTGLDDWIAKLDLFTHAQGGSDGILQDGIGLLTQFREIIDNVGGALGNLVKAEPGTVHFLGDFLVLASKTLDVITSIPSPVLEAALALHAIDLWGGLAASALVKMLNVLPGVNINFEKMSSELGTPALASDPFFWAIAAAAAITALAIGMNQASNAAKGFVNNLYSGLGNDSASQAIGQINIDLGQLQSHLNNAFSSSSIAQIRSNWNSLGNTLNSFSADTKAFGEDWVKSWQDLASGNIVGSLQKLGSAVKGIFVPGQGAAVVASNNVHLYQGAITSLFGSSKNLLDETGNLTTKGYSWSQALGIMDLAGVKYNDTASVMRQKVNNLIEGYQSMSLRAGLLSNSVNAVTLSTEMQNSQITQITSAWTSFIGLVTGGATSFVSFAQQSEGAYAAMGGAATKLDSTNGKVSSSITGITTAAGSGAASMNGLNSASLNLVSTFAQSIQSGNSEMNSLMQMTSAAGLGAKGTQMLTQASKDMVAELLPMAKGSQSATAQLYALAQQGGYHGADSFKALATWVGNVKNPMQNLDSITQKLTVDSANLATDVSNLANALNQNLNQAMAAAVLQAHGGQGAFDNFANALLNSHTKASTLKDDATKLAAELIATTGNARNAHSEFDVFAESLGLSKQKADALWDSIVSGAQKSLAAANRTASGIAAGLARLPSIKVINIEEIATLNNGTGKGGILPTPTGYASGTSGAAPGWAWVGERGPELVHLRGGEKIVPNHAIDRGYAMGAGAVGTGGDTHVHVYLNGRELQDLIAKKTYDDNFSNGSRLSGGRPTGILRPR